MDVACDEDDGIRFYEYSECKREIRPSRSTHSTSRKFTLNKSIDQSIYRCASQPINESFLSAIYPSLNPFIHFRVSCPPTRPASCCSSSLKLVPPRRKRNTRSVGGSDLINQ